RSGFALGSADYFFLPLHVNPPTASGCGAPLYSPTVVAEVVGSPIGTIHAFGFTPRFFLHGVNSNPMVWVAVLLAEIPWPFGSTGTPATTPPVVCRSTMPQP